MPDIKSWKTDNYKFVGKAFDFAYANRLNKLLPILGEVNSNSIDYELTGAGGYGELQPYDGTNLNQAQMQRGFKTIITPEEYTSTVAIGYKQAKVDKLGETRRVGTALGDTAALTVYLHALRMFSGAFDPKKVDKAAHVEKQLASYKAPCRGCSKKVLARVRRVCRGTGRRPPPGPLEQPAAPLTSQVWPGLWAVADAGMGAELSPP